MADGTRMSGFLGVATSLTGRLWTQRPADTEVVRQHQLGLGLSEPLARALAARRIGPDAAETYLNPTLKAQFPDPSSFLDMDRAAEILVDALERGRGPGQGLGEAKAQLVLAYVLGIGRPQGPQPARQRARHTQEPGHRRAIGHQAGLFMRIWRTKPLAESITSEWVQITPSFSLTPSSRAPLVTPVAAKMAGPCTSSCRS